MMTLRTAQRAFAGDWIRITGRGSGRGEHGADGIGTVPPIHPLVNPKEPSLQVHVGV